MGGLLEVLDAPAERAADLGKFPGAEDDKDDHQDYQKLRHAYSKHGSISSFRILLTVVPYEAAAHVRVTFQGATQPGYILCNLHREPHSARSSPYHFSISLFTTI